MADGVSSFTIREVTGEQRTLSLAGRALPYQPFTLEGKQRAEFTRYPGNPVASVQMLGSDEGNTTITGMWKDRFIKPTTAEGEPVTPSGVALWNGQQVRDVRALVDAAELLRLSGQLLEVQWNAIVRRGILTRFRQSWVRFEDVNWEMDFEWISRGQPEQPITVPLPPSTEEYAAKLRSLYTNLEETITESTAFRKAEGFLNTINQFAEEMGRAVEELESVAVSATNLVLTPVEAGRRLLATTNTIIANAGGIKDAVAATALDEIGYVSDEVATLTGSEDTTYGTSLEAAQYARSVASDAASIAWYAAERADVFRNFIDEEDLLAIFVARADSDLRTISTTYYGTSDNWRRLASYNGLRSSKLIAGDVVLVPKLLEGDRGT